MPRVSSAGQYLTSNDTGIVSPLPVSMAIWIYQTSATPSQQGVWCKWPGSAGQEAWYICSTSQKLNVATSAGDNTGHQITGTTTIPLNTWTHLAMVGTATTLAGYVNGVLDPSSSFASFTIRNLTSRSDVGQLALSSTLCFVGSIRDACCWNGVALTQQQIQSLAYGVSPAVFSPSYWWPLYGVDSPEPSVGPTKSPYTLAGPPPAAGGGPSSVSPLGLKRR